MSSFKTVALGLAVILISSASVEAATRHRKAVHHTPHHASRHSATSANTPARGTASRGSTASSDNSADALNARSLARSQGAAQ